jgi:hypothetical protein
MKTILLSLVLFLSFLSFSQKIIVHVFERQEMVSFSKTSIDSVLINPDYVNEMETGQTTYQIDLDEVVNNDKVHYKDDYKTDVKDEIDDEEYEEVID